MRRFTTITATLSLVASVALAQESPKIEVGMVAGLTVLSQSGSSLTHVGIPGSGVQGAPSAYASFFVSPRVILEPQVYFAYMSTSGVHETDLGIAGQVAYLFTPAATGSPYVGVNVAYASVSDGISLSGPGVGGAVGYRFTVKSRAALRVETRFRRWFSDYKDLNEFGIGVGVGALF